jgi:AraC-like DNA-binding protein
MLTPQTNPPELAAVQKMQEYIEENLREPINLRTLANAAGYSPFHAARLFKEHTGKTPFEYIRALRLSRAALILRDGSDSILTVALDFVFSSHAGFTRAFTRQFGLSPSEYRKKGGPLNLFIPYKVLASYHALHQGGRKMTPESTTRTIFVQVVERPARKLLLKRGQKAEHYYAYCEEVGCDVGGVLCSIKEALYEPVGLWLPAHLIPEGTSKYAQGVELPLDYSGAVPEGYDLIDLPPCKMMVFQGEPYDDSVFEEAIQEVWNHIATFDPTLYGYRWAPEVAPRFQLAPMGYRGYIEALPVEPIA